MVGENSLLAIGLSEVSRLHKEKATKEPNNPVSKGSKKMNRQLSRDEIQTANKYSKNTVRHSWPLGNRN